MASSNQLFRLARSVVPMIIGVVVFVIQSGGQVGVALVPAIGFVVIAIFQALRHTGIVGRRNLRGSVIQPTARSRRHIDDILAGD